MRKEKSRLELNYSLNRTEIQHSHCLPEEWN